MKKTSEFSKFRSFFWPVHRYELKKFIPMIALFFFISLNYHLLRITKDALIITAPQAGAETIPFLKVWAILPSAIFLTFLFTKFSNKFNREKIFYVMINTFLIFFFIFIFILYPHKDKLALNNTANFLTQILPSGFKGLIAIIRHWTYSLFYIMSESWSTIMVSVLLWGFANDTTKISEAKRFYPLFGIGINSAGIFAGQAASWISGFTKIASITPIITFLGGKNSWDQTLIIIVTMILFFGVCSILIYKWLHKNVFTQRACLFNIKEKKEKMSLLKNISFILKSKHLLSIAIILISYHIVINLTEVLWKSQLKELFPSPQIYIRYFSKITFFTGILATLSSFFISGNFIRKFGWKKTAFLTPVIILITGIGFFSLLFYKNLSPSIFGVSTLSLCVLFGSIQNVFSRASKYTVFDDTKEIAFIPLDPINKIKGKSAIDGIGSRLGKSGSSLMIQFLLLIFATPIAASPIIAILFFCIMPIWMTSIKILAKNLETTSIKDENLKENLLEA